MGFLEKMTKTPVSIRQPAFAGTIPDRVQLTVPILENSHGTKHSYVANC